MGDDAAILDKQLIYVPVHTGHTTLKLAFDKTYLFYNQTFTSGRYITTDNAYILPGYTLGALGVGRSFRLKYYTLRLDTKINNIWNAPYQVIAWRAMPFRHFSVTVRMGFKGKK